MKTRFVVGVFVVCCSAAGTQARYPDRLPKLNEQDKKTTAQIVELQHKIEKAECEAAAYQTQLKEMVQTASKPVRKNLINIDAEPAIVLNINSGTFIVNAGTKNKGLLVGDKLLAIRRQPGGSLQVDGTGTVARAYDTDVECDSLDNRGIRPEDEIYVLNRCSSPHYITRLKLALED